MMHGIKLALLSFLIFILEYGLAKYLAIGAAVPMLTFCYIIIVAMYEKNRETSLILALLTGALCDLAGGHGFGTYTVVYGITAWVTGLFCDSILSSKFLFMVINTFIMTLFSQTIYFLFHIIEIGANAFGRNFTNIMLPIAVYNVVVAVIMYKPLKSIFERR